MFSKRKITERSEEATPIARSQNLVVQEMPDEVLVYDLDNNKAHCLNSSAAAIWNSCDGKTKIKDMPKKIQENNAKLHYAKLVDLDFINLGLDQLQESNLLEA